MGVLQMFEGSHHLPVWLLMALIVGCASPMPSEQRVLAHDQFVQRANDGSLAKAGVGAVPVQQDAVEAGGQGAGHIPLRVITHMQYLCGRQFQASGSMQEHSWVGFRCPGFDGRYGETEIVFEAGEVQAGIAVGQRGQRMPVRQR